MIFHDLREFIDQAKELGKCRVIEGADWNLEIGRISELSEEQPDQPLLLFDKVKGYPPGYRVVSNHCNTFRLFALTHELPLEARGVELVKAYREKLKAKGEFKPITPVLVETGPIYENVDLGEGVNLLKFPAPRWHELDGGRFIGTADMVVQKDPDSGWVNLGTYRVQVHDKNTANIHIIGGQHGDLIRKKYWSKGLSCPAAVVCGGEPLLWSTASWAAPYGASEYDYTGWLRNKPVEVVRGKTVDLPIPATAEIVLEGEMLPPGVDDRVEGPFGEAQGYYASHVVEPVFKVKCVLHRNNPILLGGCPMTGPYDIRWGIYIMRAASLWDLLDTQIPGVKGVWILNESRTPITVVSIEQMYQGHAKEAALLVAGAWAAPYLNRYIMVVDHDIDPASIPDLLFALATRCDPETSIDVIRGFRGGHSDPLLSPDKRRANDISYAKGIIYACIPYSWKDQFPMRHRRNRQLLEETKKKWGTAIF